MNRNPLPRLSNGVTYCTLPDGSRQCTGSAMGRSNTLPDVAQRTAPCKLRLVSMREADRTAYDQGGAYWGTYSPGAGGMFRALGDCGDTRAEVFVRAKSRSEAKTRVRSYLPGATFFR